MKPGIRNSAHGGNVHTLLIGRFKVITWRLVHERLINYRDFIDRNTIIKIRCAVVIMYVVYVGFVNVFHVYALVKVANSV